MTYDWKCRQIAFPELETYLKHYTKEGWQIHKILEAGTKTVRDKALNHAISEVHYAMLVMRKPAEEAAMAEERTEILDRPPRARRAPQLGPSWRRRTGHAGG